MRLTHVRLLVADLAASVAFYRDVLGLEVTLDAGVYYELTAGDVILGIYGREMQATRIGTADKPPAAEHQDPFALTFNVADVDGTVEELRGRGATFVTEPQDHAEAVLRVAHLRDPDGNLIEINAPLKS